MNKKAFKRLLASTSILSLPILALPLVGCVNIDDTSNIINNDNQINDSNITNNENNTINNNSNSNNNNNNTTKPNNTPNVNIDLKPVQKPNTPNIQSNNIEKLKSAQSKLDLSLKDSKILNNVFIDDFINNTKTESDLLNYFNVTGKDLGCSYNLKTISKSNKDNTVSIEYQISLNNQTVTKTFEFSGFYHGKFEDLYKKIKDNFSFKKGYSYDYHDYTARDFLKEKLTFPAGKYIEIDWDKISQNLNLPSDVLIFDKIPNNELNNAYSKYLVLADFKVTNDEWTSLNPKKPNSITFSVEVKIGQFSSNDLDSFINPNDENNLDKTFNFEVNDFKNEELTTKLDLAEENQLKTPSDAQSYKGTLINTNFSLIDEIGENGYSQRMGEKFTWDKFKKELMYQVRFALYQQFCDNFSEINYYIKNDVENRSVTAVAEGIIKNKSENQKIYPQHLVTPEEQQTNSLNPGQKVRIEISYSGSNSDWKPTIQPDASGIINLATDSFSFAKGCDNIKNNKDLLTNAWFSFFPYQMKYNCYIDGKPIYELTPNHFIFWSFTANAKKPKIN